MAGEGFNPLGLLLSAGAAAALFFGLKSRQEQAAPPRGTIPGQIPGPIPMIPGGQPGGTIPGGTPPASYLSQFRDVQVLVNGQSAGKYANVKIDAPVEVQTIFQYQGPALLGASIVVSFREIWYPPSAFPEMPSAPQLGDELWYESMSLVRLEGSSSWAWQSFSRRWYTSVYLQPAEAIIEVRVEFMGRTWTPNARGPVVRFER